MLPSKVVHGSSDSSPGSRFLTCPGLSGLVALGDPVTGSFLYDPGTRDSDPTATRGLYVHRDPQFLLEVTLGGVSISTDPSNPELWIQVLNDQPLGIAPSGIDRFDIISRAQTALSPSTVIPGQLHILLSDPTKSAFSSDELPTTLPNLSDFAPIGTPFAPGQVATLTGQTPRFSSTSA
jgi:hypothetical protein